MFLIRRPTALLAVSAVVSLSLASCGESKVSQCNKLTDLVKKLQSTDKKYEGQLQTLQKNANLNNFNEAKTAFGKAGGIFRSFAGELKTVNQEFNKLNFNDDKLKDFRERQIKLLNEREKFSNDASKLFDRASKLKKEAEFSQLVPEISTITRNSSTNSQAGKKLDEEINSYCSTAK